MTTGTASHRRVREAPHRAAWALAGATVSFVLSQACVLVFAFVAILAETGLDRTGSMAVNVAAFALMAVSYSFLVVKLQSLAARRYAIPGAAWLVGLAAFPVCWTLLMVANPGPYSEVPALVATAGFVAAWLTLPGHYSSQEAQHADD